jgi:outer membrane protein assembly factor BamB
MSSRRRSALAVGLLALLGALGTPPAAAAQGMPVELSFHSQVFHPAAVSVGSNPDRSSGDIFLTPRNGYQRRVQFQRGPMIITGQGQLVWFRDLGSELANNLQVQHYQGKPVLTWWQGTPDGGHAEDVIANTSYQTVAIVRAVGAGYQADTHDFQITPQNTALIDVVVPVKANLSSLGGPSNGTVDDCLIQEIDIRTGKLLWHWDTLQHVPLRASYTRPPRSGNWDYFHINSIQQLPNGNLVISARNTWAVYEIDRTTGNLIWTLGGKRSNFSVGSMAKFEWQHDARLNGNILSVFDDASDGPVQNESESSGKLLILNLSTMTAVLDHRYAHSPPVVSVSQGNVQTLPNHNLFVGWGSSPEFSEYTPSGQQIFSGTFALGVQSYRAFRFPWSAQPTTPPDMANAPGPSGTVTIYASWNGATTVGGWRVLGGPTPQALTVLDPSSPDRGFETAIKLHSEPRYFEVQALDPAGHVLGTSGPHLDRPHLAVFTPAAFVESSSGQTSVPVGCLVGHSCTVAVTITAGHSTLARTSGAQIPSGKGALVALRLSPAGRSQLARAPGHHLQVEVSARDASGASATTHMVLTSYTVTGSTPARDLSGSPTIDVISGNVFVSTAGRAAILAACYGSGPCYPRATLSVNGTVIGTSQPQHLGTDELGDIYVQLTQTGTQMLAHASGNQLGAQLKLTSGADTATGQVDLIGHS